MDRLNFLRADTRIRRFATACAVFASLAMVAPVAETAVTAVSRAETSAEMTGVVAGDRLKLSVGLKPVPLSRQNRWTRPRALFGNDSESGIADYFGMAIAVTWGKRWRPLSPWVAERFVSPHFPSAQFAIAEDESAVFLCLSLGDGAGATAAVWSISLVDGGRDWVKINNHYDIPSFDSARDCRRAAAEPRLGAAARERWPELLVAPAGPWRTARVE